jgi:hypothetical protein
MHLIKQYNDYFIGETDMQTLKTLIFSISMILAATNVTLAEERETVLPDISSELQVKIDRIMIESLQQETHKL